MLITDSPTSKCTNAELIVQLPFLPALFMLPSARISNGARESLEGEEDPFLPKHPYTSKTRIALDTWHKSTTNSQPSFGPTNANVLVKQCPSAKFNNNQ